MRGCVMLAGLALALVLVAGTADADVVTHSAGEFAGTFDATEVTGDEASLQLAALGAPHWEKVSPIEGRTGHGMAYDAEDGAVVVFGGFAYGDSRTLGDTWVFRTATGEWQCMNPITAPSPRQGHRLVYDGDRDRIVLFGGYDSTAYTFFDETWTYDLDRNRWALVETATAPEARISHAMAYDGENGRIVLFGGQRKDGPYRLNDTWTFDPELASWELVGTDIAPSPRYDAMACFDDAKGVVVLFGGYIDISPYMDDETWEFDVSSMTWTEIAPSVSPVRRYGGSLANIPGTGMSLLFGGYTDSSPYYPTAAWWYDSGDGSWSRVASSGPSGRSAVGMVYDHANDLFVVFGGSGYSTRPDVWGFDPVPEEWRLLWPERPLPRYDAGFVHDGLNDRFILFGGHDGGYFNDTWAYDADTREWTLLDTSSPLEARYHFGMTYDPANEVAVLFGGESRSTYYLGDTWEFNVTTDGWTRTSTSGPAARRNHAMAYDPSTDRTVLFGGSSSGTSYRTDTMEYDASSDSWYSGGTGPAGRYDPAMAYLGTSGTVVMFGGYGSTGARDDTWEYTTSSDTWSQKTPSTTPYKRYDHSMASDPVNDRVYLYGGSSSSNLNETYYYYASGANRYWTKVSGNSIQPDGRHSAGMAFDSDETCVLIGGYASQYMDDVWHFTSDSHNWVCDAPPSRLKCYRTDVMYDPVNGGFVHFGNGMSYSNLLWHVSAEDGALSALEGYPSNSPVPVMESHCAVSPMTSELLVFGGRYYGISTTRYLNKTWLRALDNRYWDEVSEDVGPEYRELTTIEWDVDDNRGVLFGGYGGSTYFNDTWLFDPQTEMWSQTSPANAPTKRYGNAMAYDTVNGRVIVHGGYLDSGTNRIAGDTWAYDLDADDWVRLADGPMLHIHSAAFDTARGKMYVWGGNSPNGLNGDIWTYDTAGDEWTEIAVPNGPSRRYYMDMAYDPDDDVFLMRGGYQWDMMWSSYMSDVWRLVPEANEKNGIYTSEPIGPAGGLALWGSISWCELSEDAHTSVRAQIAADDDGAGGVFVGLDGTPDTYFTVANGEPIAPGTISRFLRYRFYLETTHAGRTPEIASVSVTYETVTTPSVTLHSPNGGEDLMESGSHVVTWTATGELDSDAIDLAYSADGGTTWTAIATDTADTGYYNWTVPSVETATGLVRVTVTDMYGNVADDVSDMTFAIDPPAHWPPGNGGDDDGTGDGDGNGDGNPDEGADEPSAGDGASGGPLWILVAVDSAAIAVLAVALIAMTERAKRHEVKRRR